MTSGAKPRIGLTGASGVLGAAIRAFAPDVNWMPFSGDICDAHAVADWVATGTPDAIVHLAALVKTAEVRRFTARAVNVNVCGTINLLEAVRLSAQPTKPWVFLASSSHVYRSSEVPITEDGELGPTSVYGLTKLQSEQWGTSYAESYSLDVCVARLFSFSDRQQDADFFLPGTIARLRAAARGSTLEIRGAADRRDFMHSSGMASAVLHLMQHRATGVFNIGSGVGVSVMEVVDHARRLLGREDVRLVQASEGLPSCLIANVDKLSRLGWSAPSDWKELVATLVAQH